MTSYVTPKKNTAFILYTGLEDQANAGLFKAAPTLAAGDFKWYDLLINIQTTARQIDDLGTSTYAGADTAGTTTLLSRIVGTLATGTHNPQTGDAYARLQLASYNFTDQTVTLA